MNNTIIEQPKQQIQPEYLTITLIEQLNNINVSNTKQKTISNILSLCPFCNTQLGMCHCYNNESFDSRCCGIFYHLCPIITKEYSDKKTEFCPKHIYDYCESGYCITHAYNSNNSNNNNNSIYYTILCCPCKFSIFNICFIGSICNHIVNKIWNTQRNYLI